MMRSNRRYSHIHERGKDRNREKKVEKQVNMRVIEIGYAYDTDKVIYKRVLRVNDFCLLVCNASSRARLYTHHRDRHVRARARTQTDTKSECVFANQSRDSRVSSSAPSICAN